MKTRIAFSIVILSFSFHLSIAQTNSKSIQIEAEKVPEVVKAAFMNTVGWEDCITAKSLTIIGMASSIYISNTCYFEF